MTTNQQLLQDLQDLQSAIDVELRDILPKGEEWHGIRIDDMPQAAASTAANTRETTLRNTTDMVRQNATEAAKVSGANVVNKKVINLMRDNLAGLGFAPEFLETPIGQDLLKIVTPIALHALATNGAVAGSIPHMDKLARVADYATRGAMNESFDRLIQACIPFLNGIAEIADSIDESEEGSELRAAG